MRIKYKVTFADGTDAEAVAGPPDIVAFERRYSTSFLTLGDVTPPIEHIYFLAWAPLHRTGTVTSDFETFLNNVEDVEEVQDVKPPVPTKRARSAPKSPA